MMVRRTNRSKYTIKEEVSRKPQAVRQVASELLDELGEPFDELWALLMDTHGGWEAGRIYLPAYSALSSNTDSRRSERRYARVGQDNAFVVAHRYRCPSDLEFCAFISASILMELAFVDRPVIIVIYCRFPES